MQMDNASIAAASSSSAGVVSIDGVSFSSTALSVLRCHSYSHSPSQTHSFQVDLDKEEDFRHSIDELIPSLPAANFHNFRNEHSLVLDLCSSSALSGSAAKSMKVESSYLQVPPAAASSSTQSHAPSHTRSRSQGSAQLNAFFYPSLADSSSSSSSTCAAARPRDAHEMYDDEDISASITDGPSQSGRRDWDSDTRSEYEHSMQDMEGANKKVTDEEEQLPRKVWDQLHINQMQQFTDVHESQHLSFADTAENLHLQTDFERFHPGQPAMHTSAARVTDSTQLRPIPFNSPVFGSSDSWLHEAALSASTATTAVSSLTSSPQSPLSTSSLASQSPLAHAAKMEFVPVTGNMSRPEVAALFNQTPAQCPVPALLGLAQHSSLPLLQVQTQSAGTTPRTATLSAKSCSDAAKHAEDVDDDADVDGDVDNDGVSSRGDGYVEQKKFCRSHERSDVTAEKSKQKEKKRQAKLSTPLANFTRLVLSPINSAVNSSSAAFAIPSPSSASTSVSPSSASGILHALHASGSDGRGGQILCSSPAPVLACVVSPRNSSDSLVCGAASVSGVAILPEWQVYAVAHCDDIIFRSQEIMRRDKEPQQRVARQSLNISPSTLSILLKGTYQHSKDKHINGLRRWSVEQERKFIKFLRCHADERKVEWLQVHTLLNISEDYFVAWQQLRLPLHTRAVIDAALMKWSGYLGANHAHAYANELKEQAVRLQHPANANNRSGTSPMPLLESPTSQGAASSACSSASTSPSSALCTLTPTRANDHKQKILSGRQRAASFTLHQNISNAMNYAAQSASGMPSPRSPRAELSDSKSPVTPQAFLDARLKYSTLQAKFAQDLETAQQPQPAANAALLAFPTPFRSRAASQPDRPPSTANANATAAAVSTHSDNNTSPHNGSTSISMQFADSIGSRSPAAVSYSRSAEYPPRHALVNTTHTHTPPALNRACTQPALSAFRLQRAHPQMHGHAQQLPLQLQFQVPMQEDEKEQSMQLQMHSHQHSQALSSYPPQLLHALSHPQLNVNGHALYCANGIRLPLVEKMEEENESLSLKHDNKGAMCA